MDISNMLTAGPGQVMGTGDLGQYKGTYGTLIEDQASNSFGFTGIRIETVPENETLSAKQQRFARMVCQLLCFVTSQGYAVTLGEALRTQAQANANAESGAGISNSLHLIKLAIDLQLFIDGEYKSDAASYAPLGEFWKSIGGSWGGDFKTLVDANHFSLEHNGVR
jgi:hypothetical protein